MRIDHIFVSSERVQSIRAVEIFDVVSNMSDHCVYSVCLPLNVDLCISYENAHVRNVGYTDRNFHCVEEW